MLPSDVSAQIVMPRVALWAHRAIVHCITMHALLVVDEVALETSGEGALIARERLVFMVALVSPEIRPKPVSLALV